MKTDMKNIKNRDHLKKEDNKRKQREKTFDKKKYRLKKYSNKYKSKSNNHVYHLG